MTRPRRSTWMAAATILLLSVYMYTVGAGMAFAGACDSDSHCETYGEGRCDEKDENDEENEWEFSHHFFLEGYFCQWTCYSPNLEEWDQDTKQCIPEF